MASSRLFVALFITALNETAIFQHLSVTWSLSRNRTKDRIEPVPGDANFTGCSDARKRFTDVALLMNSFSMLISFAGFEWDGSSADATDDAWLQ